MCIFQTMNEWGFLKTKTVSLSHRSRSHRSSRRRHSRSRSRRRHSRSRSYSREYRRSRSHSPMSNRRRHVGNRVRTSCISLSNTHTHTDHCHTAIPHLSHSQFLLYYPTEEIFGTTTFQLGWLAFLFPGGFDKSLERCLKQR